MCKGSFPFDGLWKNEWKIHISIVFFHDLFENQLHGEMGNEKQFCFFPILQYYISIH